MPPFNHLTNFGGHDISTLAFVIQILPVLVRAKLNRDFQELRKESRIILTVVVPYQISHDIETHLAELSDY